MILLTVGAQMPFDRLVSAVDRWAEDRVEVQIEAQIGKTDLEPQHLHWVPFMTPAAFRETVCAANAVVAHAGMGSILTALEFGKPILVMPRRGELRETRNDHQVATAKRLMDLGHVTVAFDTSEIAGALDALVSSGQRHPISRQASPELIGCIRAFIEAT